MRRTLVITFAMALTVPFLVGGPAQPASGKSSKLINRFGPSGTVAVNPPARPSKLPAGVAAPMPVPTGTSGCPDASATNVRANQECTNQSAPGFFGRSQSQNETAAAVNPRDADNILIGQNDYREGDAGCGVDWSLDGGEHWGSQIIPIDFTAPGNAGAARHYWDANGDPVVAFDSSGEAYYACLAFDRGVTADFGDTASGVFVFRSADGGASWSFPGNPVAQTNGTGEDGIGLIDKEWMAVDVGRSSPYRDRIYVAWVQYNLDFTADPIHFAYSEDHGVTWHQTGEISGFSKKLCPINFDGSPPGTCNANQFANVFTAPSGDVYVAFQNFNNCAGAYGPPCSGPPGDNHNQMLIVKSTDGGNSFGDPVRVTNYHELPDCFTYTGENFGRACVPTAPLSNVSVFRATNYPVGVAVDDQTIVVTFGSYLNRHSNPGPLGNCVPAGFNPATGQNLYEGVGVPGGCNNDILRSESSDGGSTWTRTSDTTARPETGEGSGAVFTDQWWQWSALTPSGQVATAFYDRRYGDAQATGDMDITLAVRGNGPGPVALDRITDSSMPPSNEFPGTGGYSTFLGDYNALAVGSDGSAHPAWPDTRNPIYTFDVGSDPRDLIFAGYGADIYTRSFFLGDR